MRLILPLLCLVALGLGGPHAAQAEPPAPPIWSVENIMPTAEQAPQGWKIRSKDAGPGDLGYAALEKLGEAAGLVEDVFYVEFRVFESEQGSCGVAMIDADEGAQEVRTALDALASEKGWTVRALGTPMRLLVVSGDSSLREALTRTILGNAIYTFCDLARSRLNAARGKDDTLIAVEEYVRVIQAIEPEAGVGFSLSASLHIQRGGKDAQKPDWIEWDQAIAALRHAFAPGTPFPPLGQHRFWAATRLGGLLLDKQQDAVLPEAVQSLRLALESESDAPDMLQRVDTRFWLARALARQGASDESFAQLRGTLEMAKSMLPPPNYKWLFDQVKEKDVSFGKLRQDPRFSELMSTFAPPEPKKPAGHPPTK